MRSAGRRCAAKHGFEQGERVCERVELRSRQLGQQRTDAVPKRCRARRENVSPHPGERELLSAAILGDRGSRDPAASLEPGHELREGRPGDPRPPRHLGCAQALASDRSQRKELGAGQRRVVSGEQALAPPGRESRCAYQLVDRKIGFALTRHR